MQLNKEQKQAVEHSGTPLLVAAGPGSGKTTVIVERIKHLLDNGFKPSEILCLTFTNRGAAIMKERLEKVRDVSEMQISTYHSFCHEILQDNVLDSGIGISSGLIKRASSLVWGLENFDSFGFENIEKGNDPVEVIEAMMDGISTFKDELVKPEELGVYLDSELAKEKNLVSDVEEIDYLHKLEDLHRLYVKYEEYLRTEQLFDNDDMIVQAIRLFQRKENVLQRYRNQFKYVLVDEFQDNNYAQLQLVKLLAPTGNITVVGDDDQSIMKFQGAYARIFTDFQESYKNVTTINLNRNYRSPKPVVSFSSKLLEGKPDRIEKELYSEKDGPSVTVAACKTDVAQVEFVIKKIQEFLTAPPKIEGVDRPLTFGDFTILSRTRNSGRKYAQGLNSHGIPATFVGDANLFSTSVGRDAMAYLEIATNPTEAGAAIYRVLQNSGISEQNIARINHEANNRTWKSDTNSDFVFDVLADLQVSGLDQIEKIQGVSKLLNRCVALKNKPVMEAVYELFMLETNLYKDAIRIDSMENKRKQTILKKIYGLAEDFETQKKNGDLSQFIEYVKALGKFDVELEEGADLADTVRVSTIHQSKGSEYPFVFVVDAAARSIPTNYSKKLFYVPDKLAKGLKNTKDGKTRHIEEERRIFYVAMTRAENHLFITYPRTYSTGKNRSPSKFLVEDLDFENNPNAEVVSFDGTSKAAGIQIRNREDVLIEKAQAQIASLVNSMQIKNAIEKMIDLAKIEYYKNTGSMKGFKIDTLLDIKQDGDVEKVLVDEKIPLVNKDELKLSATNMENYFKCPLQFKYGYVLQIPTKSSKQMSLGGMVHKVFELASKDMKSGIKVDKERAFDILEKIWDYNSYKTEHEAKEDQEKAKVMIVKFLEWIASSPNKIEDVEKKFNMTLGGAKVTGKIDLVMKTPEGEYQVYDFKTGNSTKNAKEAAEDIQMNLYPLAVKESYGKLPVKSSLYYIAKDLIVDNEIIENNVMNYKKTLEDAAKSILNEEFEPIHEKGACFRCNFREICDYSEIAKE